MELLSKLNNGNALNIKTMQAVMPEIFDNISIPAMAIYLL